MSLRPPTDLIDNAGNAVLGAHLGAFRFQATEHRVGVPVGERRNQHAVADLHPSRLRYAAHSPARLRPSRDDTAVRDQERSDLALGRAPDPSGKERRLGHRSSSESA